VQVLAQRPIGAALPVAIRIGNQHLDREPLHQGVDGRTIASPLEEVAFPMLGTGGHLGGGLGNRRHVRDLAASVCFPRPRPASRGAWQRRQARIDSLGQELFPHGVRILASEPSDDLLGRAALSQKGSDIRPQPGIQESARASWLTGLRHTVAHQGLQCCTWS
jgi:hypothetical protein